MQVFTNFQIIELSRSFWFKMQLEKERVLAAWNLDLSPKN